MRIRPFQNREQLCNWAATNCNQCAKGFLANGEFVCTIEKVFNLKVDDLYVPLEIAKRMGIFESRREIAWRCPEYKEET